MENHVVSLHLQWVLGQRTRSTRGVIFFFLFFSVLIMQKTCKQMCEK